MSRTPHEFASVACYCLISALPCFHPNHGFAVTGESKLGAVWVGHVIAGLISTGDDDLWRAAGCGTLVGRDAPRVCPEIRLAIA